MQQRTKSLLKDLKNLFITTLIPFFIGWVIAALVLSATGCSAPAAQLPQIDDAPSFAVADGGVPEAQPEEPAAHTACEIGFFRSPLTAQETLCEAQMLEHQGPAEGVIACQVQANEALRTCMHPSCTQAQYDTCFSAFVIAVSACTCASDVSCEQDLSTVVQAHAACLQGG